MKSIHDYRGELRSARRRLRRMLRRGASVRELRVAWRRASELNRRWMQVRFGTGGRQPSIRGHRFIQVIVDELAGWPRESAGDA